MENPVHLCGKVIRVSSRISFYFIFFGGGGGGSSVLGLGVFSCVTIGCCGVVITTVCVCPPYMSLYQGSVWRRSFYVWG